MTVSFTPTTWVTGTTAFTAAQGNRMETGINDCANAINALPSLAGFTATGEIQARNTGKALARYYNYRDSSDSSPNPGDYFYSELLSTVDQTNYQPSGVNSYIELVTGYLLFDYNETYTFYVTMDDNAMLYVDGADIIGQAYWGGSGSRTASGTYPGKSTKWVQFHLMHRNISGNQRLLFEWQSTSRSRQTIPSDHLKWDEFDMSKFPYQKRIFADVITQSGNIVWGGAPSYNNTITIASSAPGSPNTNDVWIDTSISL